MSQSEARAWWADVEHLRETIERRRATHDSGQPSDELAARRRSIPRPVADYAAALEPEAPAPAAAAPEPDPADELATHRRSRGVARREAFDRDVARRPHAGPTPADRRAAMAALAPGAASGRRTVTITGRTTLPPAPREVAPERLAPRRQASRMPPVGVGPRPDRIAMWAVVLGFMLILAAATSSHAATAPAAQPPAAHTVDAGALQPR